MHLLLGILFLVWLPGDDEKLPESDERNTTQSVSSDEEIRSLIIQLGSDKYAERQRATRRLWEIGRPAERQLRGIANHADLEIATRSRRLLEYLKWEIHPDTNPDLAAKTLEFSHADNARRIEIVSGLVDAKRLRAALDLIHKLPRFDTRHDIYRRTLADATLFVEDAVSSNDWRTADELLDHPLNWEMVPESCLLYFHSRGLISQAISRQQKRIESNPQWSEFEFDQERIRLIRLLRTAREDDQALEIARSLNRQPGTHVRALLLDQGKWSRLSDQLVQDPVNTAAIQQRIAQLGFELTVHRLAGNTARLEESRDQLLQLIESAPKENGGDAKPDDVDGQSNQNTSSVLAAMLTNFQTEQAFQLIEQVDSFEAFHLLLALNRYREAYQIVGIPDELAARQKWFNARWRQLRGINARYSRQRVSEDFFQAQSLFRLLSTFATTQGMLGYTDEAYECFDRLGEIHQNELENFDSRRIQIAQQLVFLDGASQFWHFVDKHFAPEELDDLRNNLFWENSDEASFWWAFLESRIPAERERLKALATITKASFQDPAHVIDRQSIDNQIDEYIRDEINAENVADLLPISTYFEIHGDPQRAGEILELAAGMGSPTARQRLARIHISHDEWQQARENFGQIMNFRLLAPAAHYLAGLCEQKLGNDSESSRLRMIGKAMSIRAGGFRVIASNVRSAGFEQNAVGEFQTLFCAGDYVPMEWNGFRNQLAEMTSELHPADSYRYAAGALAGLMLNVNEYFRPDDFPEMAVKCELARARVLIDNRQYEEAMDALGKCLNMERLNPGIAEDFVPLLESAGRQSDANELFGAVAREFETTLERHPDSALYHNNYAWMCARCNRKLESALDNAMTAMKLKPRNTSYLDTVAEIFYRLGNIDKAIEFSGRCVEINPRKPHYRQQLERFRSQSPAE